MDNKKIPVILDGDPGHDDAIAWIIAAAQECFDIRAITTVAGNQTLDKVTYNARSIAALLDLDVEVAKGRELPLCSELITAPAFHGESGLDGAELPEPVKEESKLSAVEMMAKVLKESDEKVTIVATGPQTNVAALLLCHPELKDKIALIATMGGGLVNGNRTALAEFNIAVDPEAAYIVYHSGVPIQMSGLDVCEKAYITPEEWEKIRQMDGPVAEAVSKWLDFYFIHLKDLGWKGANMYDPCAVLSLAYPEIFTIREMNVDIDLSGEYTRGMTLADFRGFNKANCKAVMDVDREKFVELIIKACEKYSKEVHHG